MKTRAMVLALLVLGGAACNAISGVNAIDFTGSSDTGDGSGGASSSSSSSSSTTSSSGSSSSSSSGEGGGGGSGEGGGGGAGGDNVSEGYYDIACPNGNVIVGFHGREGKWVDRIGLICAPVNGDRTLGPTFLTSTAGGDSGSHFEVICPVNQALVGVDIWTKSNPSLVYGINLLCQTLTELKKPNAGENTIEGFGDRSGPYGVVRCDPGEALVRITGTVGGLTGYSSTYVYTTDFYCFTP